MELELVDVGQFKHRDANQAPSALLSIRTGETVVQQALKNNGEESEVLISKLNAALATDINVACALLEAISNGGLPRTEAARSQLADAYIHACLSTDAPEPRTIALEALASLLDVLLTTSPKDSDLVAIPPEETLTALWSDLYQKPLSASLSDAIIRVSGPLIAVPLARVRGSIDENLASRLRNWGVMMSKAGLADQVSSILLASIKPQTTKKKARVLTEQQTFDTRVAAVEAIKSVCSSAGLVADKSESSVPQVHHAHLPWLFALYDALTDDDVEVREAASEAAMPILGLALVPVEAGARLSRWLAAQFGHDAGFRAHVAGRMIGHEFGYATYSTREESVSNLSELGWVSPKAELEEAMRFDGSLFVIEEHNQYIDEVREVKRWTDAFLSTATAEANGGMPDVTNFIAEWTLEGLRTLAELMQPESPTACDGSLGWTSKPQVFTICARIVICASALVKCGRGGQLYMRVENELKGVSELGRGEQRKFHGTLLDMCNVQRGLT